MPQNAESTTANTIPNEHHDPGLTQSPFWTVLKKLSIDDFKNTGQIPCARNSLLSGIGGGALFGIMRLLHSGNIAFATQTALGSCCLIGVGAWELCRWQRRKEKNKMKEIVIATNEARKQNLRRIALEHEQVDHKNPDRNISKRS